jgi:hypothetical protein
VTTVRFIQWTSRETRVRKMKETCFSVSPNTQTPRLIVINSRERDRATTQALQPSTQLAMRRLIQPEIKPIKRKLALVPLKLNTISHRQPLLSWIGLLRDRTCWGFLSISKRVEIEEEGSQQFHPRTTLAEALQGSKSSLEMTSKSWKTSSSNRIPQGQIWVSTTLRPKIPLIDHFGLLWMIKRMLL